jgi:hypothetical protein
MMLAGMVSVHQFHAFYQAGNGRIERCSCDAQMEARAIRGSTNPFITTSTSARSLAIRRHVTGFRVDCRDAVS